MNSGIDLKQVEEYIIKPALDSLGLDSDNAVQLVLATGLVESGYRYIDQKDRGGERPGPAYGLFQMEARTHDDIHHHYLKHKPELSARLRPLRVEGIPGVRQMQGNAYYAAAMCRIYYLRVKQPLPDLGDAEAMAKYWKTWYNTHLGAGTIEKFLHDTKPIFDKRY